MENGEGKTGSERISGEKGGERAYLK